MQILDELANPRAPPNWTPAAQIGAQVVSAIDTGGHSNFTVSLAGGGTYVFDARALAALDRAEPRRS